MAENYPMRPPNHVARLMINNSSYSRLIEINEQPGHTSDSPEYICEV